MPNGGSDCCGTCWFNTQNITESPPLETEEEATAHCLIRAIDIEKPFWTYCANHPHHNPDRVEIPVGPVYHNEESRPNTRRVWLHSPDTPAVREGLIALLDTVPEVPHPEYPFGKPFVEEVIHQLMAFQEKRSIPGLMRILSFDPFSHSLEESPYKTTRIGTVALAVEALATIGGSASLRGWQHFVTVGRNLETENTGDYYAGQDKLAVIRYHAVRGLRYCEGEEAMKLMRLALQDPHEEVRVFAEAMLLEMVGSRNQRLIIQEVQKNRSTKRNWWKFWQG